ncbi:MAG: NfeD family protein [Lachnospiraceae bacterium]|nr:NfeD family protein [Lachnospiraceae bacterium]
MGIIWIGLIVVFLIIEIITVGLTTIWFAGGALAALIACGLGLNTVGQSVIFLVVSLLLLFFTRPWALKYVTPHRTRTNYEEAVGQTVRVTETVDNRASTGTAVLNGQEWTARSEADDVVIPKDAMATVVAVSGVKLILKYEK